MSKRCAASLFSSLLLLWAVACGDDDSPGANHPHEDPDDQEDHEEQQIQLSASGVERSGIEIAIVEQGGVAWSVEVPAEIKLDPDRTAHVSPIVEGRIEEVAVSIGDRVEARDVLVRMKSVALGETRAALAESRASLREAESHFERQRQLQQEGIGAQRNLDEARAELERAQARIQGLNSRARVYDSAGSGASTAIRSPIAGEVIERHATVGEVVDPGTVLFVIADLSRVWVMGQVFAQDVAAAREGSRAALTLRSDPGREFVGVLDYVAPALDEHTRTLTVRMIMSNEPESAGEPRPLRPGLFGTLMLERPTRDSSSGASITADAVQELNGAPHVFVPLGSAEFKAVPVRVGREARGRVSLEAGLEVGDAYVSRGAFILRSELERGALGHGHAH